MTGRDQPSTAMWCTANTAVARPGASGSCSTVSRSTGPVVRSTGVAATARARAGDVRRGDPDLVQRRDATGRQDPLERNAVFVIEVDRPERRMAVDHVAQGGAQRREVQRSFECGRAVDQVLRASRGKLLGEPDPDLARGQR